MTCQKFLVTAAAFSLVFVGASEASFAQNKAGIIQGGENSSNLGVIGQSGDENLGVTLQGGKGSTNTAATVQEGCDNTAAIAQIGDDTLNAAGIGQKQRDKKDC